MKKGLIYVVTGAKKYIDECIFSAKSFKSQCPDIPVTLFTDNHIIKESCFDKVKLINDSIHPWKIKVKYILNSPYKYTLFMDSDTQVVQPIYELFSYLDDHDLAVAPGPSVDRSSQPPKLLNYVGKGNYNTGVFLYRKSKRIHQFLSKWLEMIMIQNDDKLTGNWSDQTFFNKLINSKYYIECNVKFQTFSNKLYNVRPVMIEDLKKNGELGKVKIFHVHNLKDKQHRIKERIG
ncbi:MAG: putative nucleotide-diphospho-sugar transferase [Xenococcus sp. (in: cyanobacteria)]